MEHKFKPKKLTGHRLFICLVPPKSVRDQARDIERMLTKFAYKLRFVNLEQIHLTLKFLGNNVSTKSAEMIINELISKSSSLNPIEIKTVFVEFGFPAQAKANTIHIHVEENDQLFELTNEIQKYVKALKLSDVIRHKESRKFLAHFTTARVRKDISRSQIRDIRDILEKSPVEPITFTADEIYIIESKLTIKGPIYSIYSKIPLRGK